MSKAHGFEAQLLRWSVTSNGGATLTIQFADEADLEPFKSMTMKAGKIAGQRLMVAVSKIGEQEQEEPLSQTKLVSPEIECILPDGVDPEKYNDPPQPLPEADKPRAESKSHFPAGLTGLAVRWCADEHFRFWLYKEGPKQCMYPAPTLGGYDEEWAKRYICTVCKIASRKELDTDHQAASIFKRLFKTPYAAYLDAVGKT